MLRKPLHFIALHPMNSLSNSTLPKMQSANFLGDVAMQNDLKDLSLETKLTLKLFKNMTTANLKVLAFKQHLKII